MFQGGEGTGAEEAVTDILDGALHAVFFIAPRRAARTGGEVVVGRELEEAGGSRKIVIDFVTPVA
ncbi:MAG: hypothetical protein WCD04_02945 [Terriglobia bacterium]|jgi:hypothetical protein